MLEAETLTAGCPRTQSNPEFPGKRLSAVGARARPVSRSSEDYMELTGFVDARKHDRLVQKFKPNDSVCCASSLFK